jgi:hypothetical protein
MKLNSRTGLIMAALVGTVLWAAGEPVFESTQDTLLNRADQMEQQDRFPEAITIYETLLHDASGTDSRWTAFLTFRLACAQAQAGDRLSAIESVSAAAALDPAEPSYKAFQAELQGENSQNPLSTHYHARRNQGSAKRLVATNGVLHIFVRGRNTQEWDAEEMAKTRLHVLQADDWLTERAKESGVQPLTFEHRYLTLLDEPFWRRTDAPDSNSTVEYRTAWLNALLVRFQSGSYAELFDRTFEGMDLANRTVIFHTSVNESSFLALRTFRPQPTDMESTFVPSEITEWVNFYEPVCYARELLHLYGADDLFNKVREPSISETEIMNYGAHRIDECELGPLTRYAIGWAAQPPILAHLQLGEKSTPPKRKRGTHG